MLASAPSSGSKSVLAVNPQSRFGSAKSRFEILSTLYSLLMLVFTVKDDPYVNVVNLVDNGM
jgi:hypothetical protein